MIRQTAAAHHSDPAHPAPHGKVRRSTKRLSRLILWEWGIVLGLLSGLGITVLAMSHAPDPKGEAQALVARLQTAARGRPAASVEKVAPRVCVLASWDLSRSGIVSVNGVTPPRISAAILVELCNQGETAALTWYPKPVP